MAPTAFRDRVDAGRQLAERVRVLGLRTPVVLALPRGGVPVASEVAATLDAPLEVFVARKVGAPGHEELGIGAVAEGGSSPVASSAAEQLGVSIADLERLAAPAWIELRRRVDRYRGGRPLPDVEGREVLLIDDGLATGATAEAALRALRSKHPARLVLAVPVSAGPTAERLGQIADDIACLVAPRDFYAVGQWYDDFSQTTDDEVIELLERSRLHGTRR